MTGEFPGLSRVFVSERDAFLAHALKHAAKPLQNPHPPGGKSCSYVVCLILSHIMISCLLSLSPFFVILIIEKLG